MNRSASRLVSGAIIVVALGAGLLLGQAVRSGFSGSGFISAMGMTVPSFLAPAVQATPTPEPVTVHLARMGMTWLSCKGAVEHQLGRVPGIMSFSVELPTDSVTVVYDRSQITVDEIVEALAEVGYEPRVVEEVQ